MSGAKPCKTCGGGSGGGSGFRRGVDTSIAQQWADKYGSPVKVLLTGPIVQVSEAEARSLEANGYLIVWPTRTETGRTDTTETVRAASYGADAPSVGETADPESAPKPRSRRSKVEPKPLEGN